MTKTAKSRVFWALLIVVLLLPAPGLGAGPMPPQLPSPEEMAALAAQHAAVLGKVKETQRLLDHAVRELEREQDQLTSVNGAVIKAEAQKTEADSQLKSAQALLNRRVSLIYRTEPIGLVNVVLNARNYREFVSTVTLVRSVAESDAELLRHTQQLKAAADQASAAVQQQKVAQQQAVAQARRRSNEIQGLLRQVDREFKTLQAELEKRKSGFAFPVRGAYSYTDSWGAPRMEGTSYYHRHEGTDIFALTGTPVVAVVDGVLEKVGNASLGGIKLWLRSPGDNWTYYYAHLSGYAPGVANGKRVKKGDVLGYVGNTGNARGTPPHLHFETHVPRGAATNPYPILRRVDPLAR